MNPKSRYSHLPRIFARATLLTLPALLLVTFFSIRALRNNSSEQSLTQVPSLSADWQNSLSLSAASVSKRPVFPYSVIPGGVRDAHELQTAAAADPVVARHYSDFRITRARVIRLDRPQAMYVSYRRNNQVYWTKNKMVIPAGESLISDGENLARVRCANRLSPVAALPVAALDPTAEKLNSPEFVPPLFAEMLPGEETGIFPPGPESAIGSAPASTPRVGFLGGGSPFNPPLLNSSTPPSPGTQVPPPPPVSTPEPSSLLLLAVSIAVVALFATFSLRRNASA
jgi:hypothetical protein